MMKLFTKPVAALLFATIAFQTLGTSDAAAAVASALRRNNDGDKQQEYQLLQAPGVATALKDWDVVSTSAGEERKLQEASGIESCLEAYPAPFCSCIYIDGNDFGYCSACVTALAQSKFDLGDTERFKEWFTDSTVLNLAQTGSYKGIAGIAEYVNFIYSVFFDKYYTVPGQDPAAKFFPNPNFSSDNTCTISIVVNRRVELNPTFYDDPCYTFTVGSTIYFQPTDKANGYIDISEVNVWYPVPALNAILGNMKKEAAVEWLCGTVHEFCGDTWEHNNFDNNDNKCKANYMSLPVTEGDTADITGKSLGCKLLHGTFASENQYHCAHTSFKKQEDPKGNVKCQKADDTTPESIFSSEMLAFFAFVGENMFGYDADLLFDPDPEFCPP